MVVTRRAAKHVKLAENGQIIYFNIIYASYNKCDSYQCTSATAVTCMLLYYIIIVIFTVTRSTTWYYTQDCISRTSTLTAAVTANTISVIIEPQNQCYKLCMDLYVTNNTQNTIGIMKLLHFYTNYHWEYTLFIYCTPY